MGIIIRITKKLNRRSLVIGMHFQGTSGTPSHDFAAPKSTLLVFDKLEGA